MNTTGKHLWVLLIGLCCALASASAKVERTTVYMFGFSASFTDSIAYITDVQQLDSAYIETKSGFLVDRPIYSDQLQTYLESIKGQPNCTCVVFFDIKKSKLLDEYNKIKKQYMADHNIVLKELEPGTFRFQAPRYELPENVLPVEETPAETVQNKKDNVVHEPEPQK